MKTHYKITSNKWLKIVKNDYVEIMVISKEGTYAIGNLHVLLLLLKDQKLDLLVNAKYKYFIAICFIFFLTHI